MKIKKSAFVISIVLFSYILSINNIYSLEEKKKEDKIFKKAIRYFYQKKFEYGRRNEEFFFHDFDLPENGSFLKRSQNL